MLNFSYSFMHADQIEQIKINKFKMDLNLEKCLLFARLLWLKYGHLHIWINIVNYANLYIVILSNQLQYIIPTSLDIIRMSTKLILFAVLLVSINSYTTSIAHNMTFFSDIAYDTLANINAWNCSFCKSYQLKNQKGFFSSSANIQGYAGYYPKQNAVLVSFRGSVDFKNWIFNIDTVSVGYPGCTGCAVHQGFYNAYKGVAPLVRTQVSRLLSLYRGAKLVITGHSLGGAMAVFCALDMKEIHGKVDYVYTYGQPRTGNQNFATFLQTQIPNLFRVIDYADMVPHVPPSGFGFRHGGHEIWYSPRGMKTYKVCVSEDPTCANSISSTALSTDDHSLSYYEKLAVGQTLFQKIGMKLNLQKSEQQNSLLSEQELAFAEMRKVQQIKELIGEELRNRE